MREHNMVVFFIFGYLLIASIISLIVFAMFCYQYKKETKGGYRIKFNEWCDGNEVKEKIFVFSYTWFISFPCLIVYCIGKLCVGIIKRKFEIED